MTLALAGYPLSSRTLSTMVSQTRVDVNDVQEADGPGSSYVIGKAVITEDWNS